MQVSSHMKMSLAEVAARSPFGLSAIGHLIHLVLTEKQEKLPTSDVIVRCAIVSVEDDAGITIAVLKHRTGETWDRRKISEDACKTVDLTPPAGRDPNYVAQGVQTGPDGVPLVPRHPIPTTEEVKFKLGKAEMKRRLHHEFKHGTMERITWGEIGDAHGDPASWPDILGIEGDIDIDALAKAFLSAMKG